MRQINVRRVFKILASVFPTRSDTNKAVRPQKMVRGLKFRVKEEERLYYLFNEKANQLHSYCAANLRFCFRIGKTGLLMT